MRRLFIYFIVLLLAVWLGIKMQQSPGYLLVAYKSWSIETTLWIGILIIFLFYFILHLISSFIRGTSSLSNRLRFWRIRRRIRHAREGTSRGLCELAEGHWPKAEKTVITAAANSETPLINYLAAARAAQGQGKYEKRDQYLKLAHESTQGSEVAVGLTQAQLQLESKQLEQALATLKHLNQMVPQHPFVLKLLKQVYYELKDWDEMRELLPQLRKKKILKPKELEDLEYLTYQQSLNKAAQSKDPAELEKTWHSLDKKLQKNPQLFSTYIDHLIAHTQDSKAEELLHKALKKDWQQDLIYKYGLVQGADPAKQLKTAESWLKNHGNDATLLLTLGRLCARNRLWGKAKNYLDSSTKLKPQPETYRELGRILEQLGDTNAALACYRKGLSL